MKRHIFDHMASVPLCGTRSGNGCSYRLYLYQHELQHGDWCERCESIAEWATWDGNALVRRWHERPASDRHFHARERMRYNDRIRKEMKG